MDVSSKANAVIYLAGGCFWSIEMLMQSIPGVTDAVSGYANGSGEAEADYKTVCGGHTGFRETVRVEYDTILTKTRAVTVISRRRRSGCFPA